MKKALIRFEDVGPGGIYSSEENLKKIQVIGDYLKSQDVPFHISLIPRFINKSQKYDKSISDIADEYIKQFNDTINYLKENTDCDIGMHGYTHQYEGAVSGVGFEFYYENCKENCPPQDNEYACYNKEEFINSYVYKIMSKGYETFENSNIEIDWGFSTPHYTASDVQRCILQAWCGLFFENYPSDYNKKSITISDIDNPFYRGVVYVPTPLGYIEADDPNFYIDDMCNKIKDYKVEDIAGFFFHLFLEFPFITIDGENVVYRDDSYLKRIIKCFKEEGFKFVKVTSLINFIPFIRITDVFEGENFKFFTGDMVGNNKDGLIVWDNKTGNWYFGHTDLEKFPNRQILTENPDSLKINMVLEYWGYGDYWIHKVGDFNGDGKDDLLVYDSQNGDWQVALSDGTQFKPSIGRGDYSWLKYWGEGNNWIPLVGDFNGDGKSDILVYNPQDGDWQVALSDGTKFVPNVGRGDYSWLKGWAIGDYWIPLVGDFTGDGKFDIMVYNPNNGDWQVAFSDGTKFVPSEGRGDYSWLKGWAIGNNWIPLVGDFNGDGISDILVVIPEQGDWQVALSDGNKLSPIDGGLIPWCKNEFMQPFVGDFNGDGKYSIIARHPYLRNGTLDIGYSLIEKPKN